MKSIRQEDALRTRYDAANLASDRTSPGTQAHPSTLLDGQTHKNNGEELKYAYQGSYMSFSKGL